MINDTETTETNEQTTATTANLEPTPTETVPTKSETWVKPKMTTSLPASLQAMIAAVAPSNVGNVSQFIAWILEDYTTLQAESKAYDANQDDLNNKLRQAYADYDALQTLHTALQATNEPTSTAPVADTIAVPTLTALAAEKKPMTYLEMLGL